MINYAKDKGLSQTTVLAIAQDRLGFLWFGTQSGLNRYDGYEFKQYQAVPLKPDKLAGNFITSLCDDGDHKMWIGTRSGLSVYDYQSGAFTSLLTASFDNIPADNVTSLHCDEDKVWVGTEVSGFYRVDYVDHKITAYPHSKGLRILDIYSTDKTLFLATDKGVFSKFYGQMSLQTLTEQPAKSLEFIGDSLYIGRQDGLLDAYFLSSGEIKPIFSIKLSSAVNSTINKVISKKDNVWVASNNGVYLVDKTGAILEKHQHNAVLAKSLSDNTVLSLLVDDKDNLWLGTDSAGVDFLSNAVKNLGHINTYSYPDAPLAEDDIRGFAFDDESRLWLATAHGVYIFNGKGFFSANSLYPELSLLKNSFITKIIFKNNDVWFTTMGQGAVKYNTKSHQLTHYTPKNNNAPSLQYNAIVVYKGDVLLSVRDYGLLKHDQVTNSLVPYFTGYSNASEHVTGMLVKGDELWLGSIGKGIYRFHQDTLEQLTISDGLISSLSFTLALDGKGRVWVASDAGISIVNKDFSVERVLNQDQGLMGNAVWAMIFDGQESMWVGGSDGLVQININDFKVRNFTENDGIQDFEYNFGAAWLSPLGQVFIGGANGFNQFYPKKIPEQLAIPPLFLTEIDILGKNFTQQTLIQENSKQTKVQQSEYLQEIILNYQQDILSFKFSSLAYSHQQLDYFYRVVGLSEQWLLMDKNSRQVNLIKLPPGDYQLEAYTKNHYGEQSPVYKLNIILNAPWWWSNLSKFIYVFLILSILLFIFYLRQRSYRKIVKANLAMSHLQQRLHHSLWASGDELWDWDVVTNEIHRHSVTPRINYGQELKFINKSNACSFVHPDDRAVYEHFLEQCVHQQIEKFEMPIRVQDLSGNWCWVLDKGKVISRDVNGKAIRIAGAFKDIEQLKQHEQSLEQLNENLELKVQERTQELSAKNEKVEQAMNQLKQAQNRLIESEKMAALGGLVAGIAHEINTPLGISITAISHNQDSLISIKKLLKNKVLRQSDLEKAISVQSRGYRMVLESLERANMLISNFKQVAVDQSSESKREINLTDYIWEVRRSLVPLFKKSHIRNKEIIVNINGDENINIETYPGALFQIFSNLIENSLNHGFEYEEQGIIDIDISESDNKIKIIYQDDGGGMSDEMLKQVFDPFVTSKRNQGGSGLGMHIVFNLVSQLFKGEISCLRNVNRGIKVAISFPKPIKK
ncbi:MAG: PAS domain-containing protein [Colwellia sp.]|nr:PAS domain-containing protein [Colwellia sp.]